MKYLIISDVHGNLPALESVLKKEKNIDGYVNLGDVVNYGPWSNECVERINDLKNCINIMGNHEEYFNSGVCNVKNPLVQAFFYKNYPEYTMKKITDKYEQSVDFMGFTLIHNLLEKGYVFADTDLKLTKNTILGHSHQQYLRKINQKILFNPGSVGQNRKSIDISNYAIWDIKTGEFFMKNIKNNIGLLINEMKHRNFPKICINYYKNKINAI